VIATGALARMIRPALGWKLRQAPFCRETAGTYLDIALLVGDAHVDFD